jgi:protein-disulfide isomerase
MNPLRLTFAAIGTAGVLFYNQSSTGSTAINLGAVQAQTAAEDIDTSGVLDMTLGAETAEITVYEYASFTCPHCANFHKGVFGQIKDNYIETGKIKFVHREIYFDRYGLWAGMVARCAGPDRYFGIVDIIYNEQADWRQGEPAQIADNLRKIGLTAGIEPAALDACMNDADKAQALYAAFQKNSEADSIRSTPSFVIDGQTYTNMSYTEFADILDGKLGG